MSAQPPHPILIRRNDDGLSLRALAALCGVHYVKLHYLEHGARPRPDELEAIARALKCEPADLQPGGAA